MYRLPKQELFDLSSLPCPSDDAEIIGAAKALRSFCKIEEKSVCSTCARKCPFRNEALKADVQPNIGHVYLLLLGIYTNQELDFSVNSSASTLLKVANHLQNDLQSNDGLELEMLIEEL